MIFGIAPLIRSAILPVVAQKAPDALTAETFRFVADHPISDVHLAGSFNGWNKLATPMHLDPDGKTWSVSLSLKPGQYWYKFVCNGTEWVLDPNGENKIDLGGNVNSLRVVYPADFDRPADPNDGHVTASALEHSPEIPYLNFDRGHLTFTLRERPNDVAQTRLVVDKVGTFVMNEVWQDSFYDHFSVKVPWNRKSDLTYHFELTDGDKVFRYGPGGLGSAESYRLVAHDFKPFVVPNWVEKSVIYQIFPDRFANGDPKNDPAQVVNWTANPTYSSHFGGDFAGVREHLDYLKKLGVTTVYFNPIFQSRSNHRYDTTDYLKVDPELGTNAEFAALTHEMHRDGIRTVVDGVFNHTSTQFFAFDDVVKNGSASKYTGWYTFRSFPVRLAGPPNFVAWNGFGGMPKLNVMNPEVHDYLLNVPKTWAKRADIAGWRLDVANEVSMDYWRDFRKTVKAIDPNTWIVGEEWGNATAWLKGDQWDSVMNYPFRSAILNFVGKNGTGKPSQLAAALTANYSMYTPQVSRNLMNLVGSHDTPRILTECDGDAKLTQLAADIQFTWAGVPTIYYGDEIGMSGGADPDNRRGMNWFNANDANPTLQHYRRLTTLRRNLPALQSGDPIVLSSNDDNGTLCFARVLDAKKFEVAFVAINRSDKPQNVAIPTSKVFSKRFSARNIDFVDALDNQTVSSLASGECSVLLAPKSAAVLIPRSGSSRLSRLGIGSRRSRPGPVSFSFTSFEVI